MAFDDIMQEALWDDSGAGMSTNVDIVFVIDATWSMQPIFNTVKQLALTLHQTLEEGLKKNNRSIQQLRVKVIAFRDFYVDGDMALEESDFFYLPEQLNEFRNFISNIQVKGGGDEPESALEALSVAMRAPWTTEGDAKRHIIVLFTDAPAHPLEKQFDGIPENYPEDMFKDNMELITAWGAGGQGRGLMYENLDATKMDKNAKRLVLFHPYDYEWETLANHLEYCFPNVIERSGGGRDINLDLIISELSKSVRG